jgi:hypothetical protein
MLQRAADGKQMEALHWQMQKVNPAMAVVALPPVVPAVPQQLGSLNTATGADPLTDFRVAPLKLDGKKEESGRRGQQFTQAARQDAAIARARRAEDIDLDPYAAADQTPLQTRAGAAPVAARVRKAPPQAAAASKPKANKKAFKIRDRVTVYYPAPLKQSYTGTVTDKSDKGVLTVQFDPTSDEPNGSIAEISPPYSFTKKI